MTLSPDQFPPDPTKKGRPHWVPTSDPDMFRIYDETGETLGMSSREQADRYVKRRTAQVKGMATRRKNKQ